MKEANHNKKSALDYKWFSFHMGEVWNSYWYLLVFTKLLNWTSYYYCGVKLESNDYPLLQDSKG